MQPLQLFASPVMQQCRNNPAISLGAVGLVKTNAAPKYFARYTSSNLNTQAPQALSACKRKHPAFSDIRRDGFAVIKGLLTTDEVTDLRQQIERMMAIDPDIRITYADGSMRYASQALVASDKAAHAIPSVSLQSGDRFPIYATKFPRSFLSYGVYYQRFLKTAEMLLDEPASELVQEYAGGEVFNKIPGCGDVPPHQDNAWHFLSCKADGSGGAVRLFLAFDKMDAENGTIRYVPGSHKAGFRQHVLDSPEMKERDLALGIPLLTPEEQQRYNSKARLSGEFHITLAENAYTQHDEDQVVLLNLEPGDCVAHFPNTIHRSDPNRALDPPRTRMGYAVTFEAEHASVDMDAVERTPLELIYEERVRALKKCVLQDKSKSG